MRSCIIVLNMAAMITPTNRFQARRWNHFNKGDYFWPINSWPNIQRTYAMKEHLNNSERAHFFFFLANNGLDPELIAECILWEGHTYDKDALRHIKFLQEHWTQYHYVYWNMSEQKYIKG
nr:MAG: hypothetical protein [Cressdnaviricota sp.]